MGFVLLFNAAAILALARPRVFPRKGPMFDIRAFKDPVYALFAVGVFFTLWGLYVAYFYVTTYGKSVVHISESDALTLLIILNGGGIPGRIVPAYLADRYFGVFNTLLPFTLGTAIMLYVWPRIHENASFYAFAVLYGICANAVQTLFPTTLSQLTKDMSKVGAHVGMVFTVGSVACLTGPPIAGRLIDHAGGKYWDAQMFAGSTVLVGVVFMSLSRWFLHRWNLTQDANHVE
jgi:predicted MFS family arabinose efflux permease